MSNQFTCIECGETFSVPQAALDKYPGWTPRKCLGCRDSTRVAAGAETKPRKPAFQSRKIRLNSSCPTLAQVLERFHGGPKTGLFTDGSAQPNPGPGGWGTVYVKNDRVVIQRHGHEPDTTNNRMELIALIEGYKMVPKGIDTLVFTDSELCFNTLTKWAAGWKARGWRRKSGAIKNLELVQELYALYLTRPELKLQWTRGHAGSRWNEYADSLSTAWTRHEL